MVVSAVVTRVDLGVTTSQQVQYTEVDRRPAVRLTLRHSYSISYSSTDSTAVRELVNSYFNIISSGCR